MASPAYPPLDRLGADPPAAPSPRLQLAYGSAWAGRALSVLRIVAAFVYLEHGLQKIFNFPPATQGAMPYVLQSLMGAAGLIETIGGCLLLVGLLTRPVAFITCGEMAVAYFKVHFPKSIYPINNGGDNVVLLCFFFLFLVFAGAGSWSLDAAVARRRQRVNIRA